MKIYPLNIILDELFAWLEFIFKNIPGRVGIFLRNIFYSIIKGKVLYISVGNSTVIKNIKSINFEKNIKIGPNCFIDSTNGYISIDQYSAFNEGCHINASIGGKILIGKKVIFGPKVIMRTANHKYNVKDKYIQDSGHNIKDIKIEDNCWVAGNVTILGGVTIGSGSVIGAGAVVTKDIPPNSIAVGVPAKFIKQISYE